MSEMKAALVLLRRTDESYDFAFRAECGYCRKRIIPQQKFCHNCGAKLDWSTPQINTRELYGRADTPREEL